LAQGFKSFKELGKNYTSQDLFKIKNRVIIYLKQILMNIKTYLENQDYLET